VLSVSLSESDTVTQITLGRSNHFYMHIHIITICSEDWTAACRYDMQNTRNGKNINEK